MNDTTETKDGVELEDEGCCSNCPYMEMPTSLEETLEDADWYAVVLEELFKISL